jgi:hypothetical protein
MSEERTCGQGLAEHAAVPAKAGELIDALAENLDLHLSTLDLSDERSRNEDDVYRMLVREYSRIAAHLAKTAQRMAGFRDLPMGKHDADTMGDPKLRDAFEHFVTIEEELLHLLEARVARDRSMLSRMGKAAG